MTLREMIYHRKSCRSFTGIPVDDKTVETIRSFPLKPLYPDIQVHWDIVPRSQVKCICPWTTPQVLTIYSEEKEGHLPNIGFLFQQMDLYLQSLGLGVCWLGMGRMNPKTAAQVEGMKFVIMLAFGHPKGDQVRHDVKEFKRKDMAQITDRPDPGLEAARLAPSAVNSQPWYFTHEGENIHVYCAKKGSRLDIGIALAQLYVENPETFRFYQTEDPAQLAGYDYVGSVILRKTEPEQQDAFCCMAEKGTPKESETSVQSFISRHKLDPACINGEACLELLLEKMEKGLAGKGNIPMIPSYLSLDTRPIPGQPCCVMDAGGTNLRVGRAVFAEDGTCGITDITKIPMPGTQGELSFEAFYGTLADLAQGTGCTERVGLCFSYNVVQERNLDGILHSWCKEVRVPEAPGKPVGASLRNTLGSGCGSVNVLNDSTAALLGAHGCDSEIRLGLILGTGINICYSEQCSNIPKVPGDLRQKTMIISTEIGEFDGFPKSTFDELVIRTSDEPAMAHAEKQCAGGYLGELINLAWQEAVGEGLLPDTFAGHIALPRISDYLAGNGEDIPECAAAKEIASIMICRAAKIAAVLTAGAVVKSCTPGQRCAMVIEGSQYAKLTGFGKAFRRELDVLLEPYKIEVRISQIENSCLIGAAIAAFAEPM